MVGEAPLNLDAAASPRLRTARRLIHPINGRVPAASSHDQLSAVLYGNSAVEDVSGYPGGASADESGAPWDGGRC